MSEELWGSSVSIQPRADVSKLANPIIRQAKVAFAIVTALIPDARIIITSGYRKTGSHSNCHCLDWVINSNDAMLNDPAVKDALIRCKSAIEFLFRYGVGNDGQIHHAFVWDTDDKHRDHVHQQANPRNGG